MQHMHQKSKQLRSAFQNAKYGADHGLPASVWNTIITRENRMARVKLWVFGIIGTISLIGLVPALQALSNNMTQSGFSSYFSLIFSDGGSIASFWKEFILSLGESLPILSVIFALSLLFVCGLSLRYFVKQIGRNQLTNNLSVAL